MKDRDRLLEEKFQQALKRAEEEPDDGPYRCAPSTWTKPGQAREYPLPACRNRFLPQADLSRFPEEEPKLC